MYIYIHCIYIYIYTYYTPCKVTIPMFRGSLIRYNELNSLPSHKPTHERK